MRKLIPTLAITAALTSLAALSTPATASVLGGPQGLRPAIDALDVTDRVHCRPGRWHHSRGSADGCYRRYYGPRAYYGGPYYRSYYGGPYAYGGPYYRRHYWGGPGIYLRGPGFSFGFGAW
jgi:hypothetical protein